MKKTSKRYRGVRQVGEGIYEISFVPYKNAKRFYRRIKADSLQEAHLEKIRLLQECLVKPKESSSNQKDVSFKFLRAHLERDFKGDGLRKKTITRALNTFDAFFIDFLSKKYRHIKTLNDLSTEIFNEYKNYIANDLKRIKGWRTELGTLKGVINRFVRAGFCDRKIKEILMEFKKPSIVQKQYRELTREDKQKILDFMLLNRPNYYRVTYFLIRLGWRIEETLSIKRKNVSMINFKPVKIKLEGEYRKNGKEFVLETIDEGLAKVICECMFDGNDVEWLFVNQLGHKIHQNRYRDYLTRICEKLINKKVTPHDFRHSFVTEAGLKNMPIRDVMAITGHLDIDVVLKFYSHSTSEGREKVLDMSKL